MNVRFLYIITRKAESSQQQVGWIPQNIFIGRNWRPKIGTIAKRPIVDCECCLNKRDLQIPFANMRPCNVTPLIALIKKSCQKAFKTCTNCMTTTACKQKTAKKNCFCKKAGGRLHTHGSPWHSLLPAVCSSSSTCVHGTGKE